MKKFNLYNDTMSFLDKIAPCVVIEQNGRKSLDSFDAEEAGIHWDEIASFLNELLYKGMGSMHLITDVHGVRFEFNDEIFDNTYYSKDGIVYKYKYKF
jgi:hypothetical protein